MFSCSLFLEVGGRKIIASPYGSLYAHRFFNISTKTDYRSRGGTIFQNKEHENISMKSMTYLLSKRNMRNKGRNMRNLSLSLSLSLKEKKENKDYINLN
jgi:hypothetical protein